MRTNTRNGHYVGTEAFAGSVSDNASRTSYGRSRARERTTTCCRGVYRSRRRTGGMGSGWEWGVRALTIIGRMVWLTVPGAIYPRLTRSNVYVVTSRLSFVVVVVKTTDRTSVCPPSHPQRIFTTFVNRLETPCT